MGDLAIERVVGAGIAEHLGAIAALRIAVFREYPYLYAGTEAYERTYLATYAASADSLVVLARDGDRVVGAATAMPLVQHSEAVLPPLAAAGYAPERVFYFGESVLDPAYRGRRIGDAFFAHREAHARERGFGVAAFCAVVRPDGHPRRPPGYRPLARMWERHGFVARPDVMATFSWRDLDDAEETPKPMMFWVKDLT
ncbi:MAG: GNAT family N-acetyltransferase [Deltaproteobacteria bacterium]|nr:GNAT family N-acetyltransferase [Deltaproteobacteria bacterium]